MILVIPANILTETASLHNFCFLTYELYYKNGLRANESNSILVNLNTKIGLYLTSNRGFSATYYFKAISTSYNPPYSNSINSNLFTINVKSDPRVV